MVTDIGIAKNAKILTEEMNWLSDVLDCRLSNYFGKEAKYPSVYKVLPPNIEKSNTPYANLIKKYTLDFEERLLLALTLAPHIKPELLDVFFIQNATFNRGFTEFGGIKGTAHGGFLPTGETFMFLITENKLDRRFTLQSLFNGDHLLAKLNIITITGNDNGEPFLSGRLMLSREYLALFTTGKTRKPNFSRDFPAKLIETELEWNDLILPKKTRDQIEEIQIWINHGQTLMHDWQMKSKIRPGIRALFYGPPGTGKTMTSCLLGKLTDRDVYRIDLSMVISKYIGETEENLGNIFNQAENKNWILFFDEADALFGSRIQTESSNDMFANQQVSYLLQRIEDFDGVVILSSNMKNNIDQAFIRRFETMVNFAIPAVNERLAIWKNGFSAKTKLDTDIDLKKIAADFELTGGVIMNVIRFSSMMALKRKTTNIRLNDILVGIRREFLKEGKTL